MAESAVLPRSKPFLLQRAVPDSMENFYVNIHRGKHRIMRSRERNIEILALCNLFEKEDFVSNKFPDNCGTKTSG
jgi:hypothetical protein